MTEGDDRDVVRRERFSGGPARSFLSSLAADKRIFAADIAVDRAHVVMLAEQGIIDDSTAGAILEALEDIEAAGHGALPEGEDVHAAIETAVIDRVGPDGGRMHTARSRNDEVATCLRYRLRNDLLDIIETLCDVREQLLNTAEAEAETLLPGYTHLQPAQPITAGFWMVSYASAFARDVERLLDAYRRVNRSPLGAAAFAGTTFDIDRAQTAALLGFDGIVENAMDAVAGRDVMLEAVGATVPAALTASGLAEDGILFANRGFLEPADAYASTSSIMPQKKNPDTLELVRATAGEAIGAYTGLASTLKGLPRAYNRDLQDATQHVWRAVDAVDEAVEVAGGAIVTADWAEETAAAAAGEGFATATGVADVLARSGIPFRQAHEIVAVAAESIETADPEAAIAALDAAGEEVIGEAVTERVTVETLRATLDPAINLQGRDSRGGPAPAALKDSITTARESLVEDRDHLQEHRGRLTEAETRLATEVDHYV
ncbi:MAG: argininosuccinate lyase [Salinarchaeum sp.]